MLCCPLRCFCTFSCKNFIDLGINGRIEHPTLTASRLVRFSTRRTFRAGRLTRIVTVPRLGTSAAHLWLRIREGHVAELETLEILLWPTSGLEHSSESRLAVHVEVLALQKLYCVGALRHVHDYRPVRL